LKILASNFADR